MSNEASNKEKSRSAVPRWAMARGETVVASAGIAVGAVLVAVLAASSWWTLYTYRDSLERARREQVQVVGRLLADSAISNLANHEVSQVRRMVSEAAIQYGLVSCRIVLKDGTIVADADTSKISKEPLPPTWRGGFKTADGPAEGTVTQTEAGVVSLRVPLEVSSRGEALLEIDANVRYPLWADTQVQMGIGAIGAAGMIGLLLAYRSMRRRLRGLGAIGDALRCAESGEASSGALTLSEDFGIEARAWNRLLAERDAMREKVVLAEASEKLHSRGARDGDLASACDALWAGLVILDENSNIKYANGAAAVLLRAKREEMAGAPLTRFVDNAGATASIGAVAAGKTRQRTSVELEREAVASQSGIAERAVLRLTARPMRREDSASAIMLIEDVTQQRVADEARNAFVAQATHELRTPLTNIRLYIETLLDNAENDPQIKAKCINVISQEARRLERIVTDMLSVSEIEAGSLRLQQGEIRLDALFEELEADFRAQADDKEIKLAFDLPPKFPLMQGDRDKMMLALHNLLGNALKYTPTGGSVGVRVQAGPAVLTVDVSDNGIGINNEELELIFEKFYRAKDRRIAGITGSGIGLALARQVVRLHGGDISVKSEIDKGSTFTLIMPLNAAASPARAAA